LGYIIQEQQELLLIAPNPTTEKIKAIFFLEKNENIWFYIYDLQGKLLYNSDFEGKIGHNVSEFDLQSYPTGIYIFKLENSQKVEVKKFVKN